MGARARGHGAAAARGRLVRRGLDGQVGGDRALPLLEPRGRADGRPLARAAAPAAAAPRLRPGLHAHAAGCSSSTPSRRVAAAQNSSCRRRRASTASRSTTCTSSCPGAEGAGIAYALFEPDSGFADPVATTRAYIEASRRAGRDARSRARRSAAIEIAGGRVRGVRVGDEVVECDSVVLAAGPWSIALAYGIGLELPLEVTREQDVVYDVGAGAASRAPISSQVDRIYMRPAPEHGDRHMLVGRGYPKEYEQAHPDAFDDDGRRRVRGGRPRAASATGCRELGGHAGRRRARRPVRRDARLASAARPGRRLRGAVPRDRRQRPLLQARRRRSASSSRARSSASRRRFADVETFSLSRFAEGRALGSSYGGNRA